MRADGTSRVELLLFHSLGGLMRLLTPLLHLVRVVEVVGERVMNGGEVEVIIRCDVLWMLTFVYNTSGDVENANTSALDPWFTPECILCGDDLGHSCSFSRVYKEVCPHCVTLAIR